MFRPEAPPDDALQPEGAPQPGEDKDWFQEFRDQRLQRNVELPVSQLGKLR